MRRLLREPVTLVLVLLCVGWTLYARARGMTPIEAGALTTIRLWEGEYWRLFSAMILHQLPEGFRNPASWIHLLVNGLSLLLVGRVIERQCGRAVFLACTVGGALACSAASLIWHPEPTIARMGISGGIAGLLGLLLALEWAASRGFLDFLRQRNTILILLFLGLSIPLAMFVESRMPSMAVDHAGHAGGLAFGLLAGVACYTRKGPRRVRGAIAAILLSIVPVAYASHPLLEPEYRIWRAHRAYVEGRFEAACREFERAKELDPAALDRADMRDELLDGYLRVAATGLGTAEGKALVAKALALGGRRPAPWLRFGEAAEAAGRPDEAYTAWRQAALLQRDADQWMAFQRALRLLRARETLPLRETIEVARGAARGLRRGLPVEAAKELERQVATTADALAAREDPPEGDDARALSELYRVLAENALEDARRPGYRLRSAEWMWRGSGDAGAEGAARFKAVITEAALYGDPAAAEGAAKWFRERGMAVPEPDLEEDEGGG